MSDQKLKNGESPTQKARPKSAYYENSYYYTVNLTRDENCPFGIQLSPEGQHVDSLEPESPAAINGKIEVGDKLIAINGTECESKSLSDIKDLLDSTQCELKLFHPPIVHSSPSHRSTSLNLQSIQNNIKLYKDAIRKEEETQSDLINKMSSLDEENEEIGQIKEEIKKSRERETDFRQKILSYEDGAESEDKESNWAGLKSMVDSDEITVNGMAQFVLFCLSKSLLNQLLFVENVINLQTEKKPLDQAKRIYSTYLCSAGLSSEPPNFILSDFISEDDEQGYSDEINRIGESLHDSSTDCRGLFTKLKSTVAVRIEEAFDDFTGYKMEQKLKNPAFDQKTLDELFIEDCDFQELIKVESIADSNKNPIPEKLAYSIKLLRALIEILKPSKNTKGRKKDKNYLEQQLSQREKLLKADMKAQGRPKSTIYAIGANLIGAGANKVRRWETMINRPKTNDEGNKSERGMTTSITSPNLETSSSFTSLASDSNSPQVSKKNLDNDSIEETLEEAVANPWENDMNDKELQIIELIAWETQVKKENPDFNLDELSKKERARQMVIHELINVHHNACIKINFLINIFKPTIIRESKLKEAQLGKIFRNIKEIKTMFDELKDDLERKQQAEWPQISGIGEILLDHFDLESEKGMNFQQQVAKWISCDADANKEVKKYQDIPGDVLDFNRAIEEGNRHPCLNRLEFSNVLTVIFQIMPRYPMLLTQLLKYTDTDENKENESLMKEVKLLDQAKNCIQVTVSETNKRAGEEDLKNLLTDIKTHLNISMFLVAARTDKNLQKIVDDNNVQSREFLDYTRVIKYGACNISDPNATKTSQNQPKNTQKPSDITYLLLTDSFVFFTKTHHENKTIYEYSIHSQENNEQKTFYFFPLESLHITKDATNATQLFLLHLSGRLNVKINLGTADNAMDLLNSFNAQKDQNKRNIVSTAENVPEESENKEIEDLEDIEDESVFDIPDSIPSNNNLTVDRSSTTSPRPPVSPVPPDTKLGAWTEDKSEDTVNDNESNPPEVPHRSIRRNGFRRTVMKFTPAEDLLNKLTNQISDLEQFLIDTPEAQDAFVDLQQTLQRYKNSS